MRNVYLHGVFQEENTAESHVDLGLSEIPMLRRMTPLQIAVMATLLRASIGHGAVLEQLAAAEAPLYFASAYGELGAMIRVIQSIARSDLPVSPKDFQHSVLNASLAYISIQRHCHAPGYALSGGYTAADSALHLAVQRIASGIDEGALLFHGHEGGARREHAQAELFILSATPCLARGWRLGYYGNYDAIAEAAGAIEYSPHACDFFSENEDPQRIPWLGAPRQPQGRRRVVGASGKDLVTEWQEWPHDR